MRIRFQITGSNFDEVEASARERLRAYMGERRYEAHFRYEVEPMATAYGGEVRLWEAAVEVMIEVSTDCPHGIPVTRECRTCRLERERQDTAKRRRSA